MRLLELLRLREGRVAMRSILSFFFFLSPLHTPMIQRIQTIYLFIALVMLVVVNFFPFATYGVEGGSYALTSWGVDAQGVAPYAGNTILCWALPASSLLAAVLALVAIMSYKQRVRQMRLCVYGILAVLAFHVALGVQAWTMYDALGTTPELTLTAQLPLLSVIFFILAGRAVKRDEALVRSMDRIR